MKLESDIGAQANGGGPPGGVSIEDFRAYMPSHAYVFMPTRELWPASSVNARVEPVIVDDKPIPASKWLDANAAVEQMTWAPGAPALIGDRLIAEGGWIEYDGVTCLNLYRPPDRIRRRRRSRSMARSCPKTIR